MESVFWKGMLIVIIRINFTIPKLEWKALIIKKSFSCTDVELSTVIVWESTFFLANDGVCKIKFEKQETWKIMNYWISSTGLKRTREGSSKVTIKLYVERAEPVLKMYRLTGSKVNMWLL